MEGGKAKSTRRQRLAAERTRAPKGTPAEDARSGEPRWRRAGRLSRFTALGAIGLGLIVAVSYLPTVWAGFVWDDKIFSEEPVLREWSGLWSIWFDPADIKREVHYWPIVYSSFWLEHKLWGLAPLGYHLVNVVLHMVSSLLVWRLLSRLAVPGAWAVAAVFAVHPVHVESVAWVIERKDLLSGMFYFSAVLTWIRFVESPGWSRYGLTLALFCAGMLSKSVVVTLPAVLLIWQWWQRDRVTSTDLLRLLPFFVVGLAIAAGDYSFYTSWGSLSLGYSFVERVLIASRALWFYVGKLLWPTDLAVIYPRWDIRVDDPLAWAYVAGAAALAALLWFGRHRMGRGPLAGALFFAVTLSPVLGFVDYGYMQFAFVADRFQYLAGTGVMAVLIGGAAWGEGRLPHAFQIGARGLLAAALVLLGTLTWTQTGIYRDEAAFFGHIIAHNPEARDAHFNLGHALINTNRLVEGLAVARIAVKQRPDFAPGYSNVGVALLELERFEEAVASYRAALRVDPDYALAHAGLAHTLLAMKRYEEALASLTRSIALEPDSLSAAARHVLAGQAARAMNQVQAAADHFNRARTLDPHNTHAMDHLAMLRFGQKRYQEALTLYRKMLEVNPDNAQIHSNAGATFYYLGRPEEARRRFERALALKPDLATAQTGLKAARKMLEQSGK